MGWLRVLKKEVDLSLFRLAGCKPWSRGYGPYRENEITKALAAGGLPTGSLPNGYGFRLDERIIEYPWLFSRLPAGSGRLLDAGSVLNHGFLLRQPKLKEKNVFVSTLAPEGQCYVQDGVSYVFEDFRDCCFRGEYFDWVVSLSTLEHVGMDNTVLYTDDASKRESDNSAYLHAVRELWRVLKPGGKLFVSVPFGVNKNHGWFQIFDSDMVDRLIEQFKPAAYQEFHYRYLPSGWVVSSREDSSNGSYFDIHTEKGYAPDFAAASRSVVCIELLK